MTTKRKFYRDASKDTEIDRRGYKCSFCQSSCDPYNTSATYIRGVTTCEDCQTKIKDKIKGAKNGLCNRMVCLSPTDVIWFNHSTRMYYCTKCATLLNNVNDDLEADYGHPLCTRMDECPLCDGSGESPESGGPCCGCDGFGYLPVKDD